MHNFQMYLKSVEHRLNRALTVRKYIVRTICTFALIVGACVGLASRAEAAPFSASYCTFPNGLYAFSWAESTNPSTLIGHGWNVYFNGQTAPTFFVAWGWPWQAGQNTAIAIGNRWYPTFAHIPDPSAQWLLQPRSIISSANGFRNGASFAYSGAC